MAGLDPRPRGRGGALGRAGARRRPTALVVAAALCLGSGASGCYRSPTALAEKGEEALRAYQLDEAEAAFLAALDRDPTLPRALYGLGWIYLSRGDTSRARTFFERCMQMDPTYFGCHRGLGSLHLNMGYYAQAEESFKRAAALAPADPGVQGSLGLLYLSTDRLEEAEAAFERALSLGPDRGEVLYGVAELRLRQGRLDDATAALDEAVGRGLTEVKFQELVHELRARVFAARAVATLKGRGDPPAEPWATQARELYQQAVDELDRALEAAVLRERHRLHRFRERMIAERDRLAEGRVRGEP